MFLRFTALQTALLALVLAFGWQASTVQFNYGGDWSALFCAGERFANAPELPPVYRFRNSFGYDGQVYRMIAHDPLFQRGLDRYIDSPRVRYRRILIPGLAHVLALGQTAWIDAAYHALILLFTALGAYWSAQWAARAQWPPLTGVLFLLVPATLVSLDRSTVDGALAALVVGSVLYSDDRERRPWALSLVLAAACMCRETGLILVAAAVVKHFRLSYLLATIPFFAWSAFVQQHTDTDAFGLLRWIPFQGWVERMWQPRLTAPGLTGWIVLGFDTAALGATGLALWMIWRWRQYWLAEPGLWLQAIPVAFVSYPEIWSEPYAFGRTMTPFYLMLALVGVLRREARWAAPMGLVTLATLLPLAAQGKGIVRGLWEALR